ncbi:hypothetical protein HPP92_013628 [Vanilla planifolia]|uniref:SMC hinge domain-containing protein n=1 Tax=Vanilla planifolia TaxID=51239 RepID=A0A835QZS0_VANPL|nr:hypothetical protein HPP92_013628 [Vanilla planifolia]
MTQYMQWANGNTELDRLRGSVLPEFVQAEKARDSTFNGVVQIKMKIDELDDKTESIRKDIEMMDNNISKLIADREAKLGGQVGKLSQNVDELSRTLVKESSILANHEESLKSEQNASNKLTSKRDEAAAVENELKDRKKELDDIKSSLDLLAYEEGQLETLQKVKGVITKLITVKDMSTMTALEVAAGGKLFNVVVDNENTGKQLLQNGDLRRRVTLIPLNKIQSHVVPIRVQQAATRLVGEYNAELALLLVGYDEEVKNAMTYVFGSTFVCQVLMQQRRLDFKEEDRT